MRTTAWTIIIIGLIFLLLSLGNGISADLITPSFQRAEILSAMSGIILMVTGSTLLQIHPIKAIAKSFPRICA